eukprot:COSAG05_NODE_1116_length_5825_cov_11.050304_9_plen_130_part_00
MYRYKVLTWGVVVGDGGDLGLDLAQVLSHQSSSLMAISVLIKGAATAAVSHSHCVTTRLLPPAGRAARGRRPLAPSRPWTSSRQPPHRQIAHHGSEACKVQAANSVATSDMRSSERRIDIQSRMRNSLL